MGGLRVACLESPPVPGRYPRLTLEVARPSAGRDRAVVEAGVETGVLAGRGVAKVWRRTPDVDGPLAWEETDEVFSSWRR